MGDYQLDTPMYVISMGAADIVLGVQWLTTLGTIEMNFQELFMQFQSQGKVVELRGLKAKSPQMVSSHQMQKLLMKDADGLVAQLCSLKVSQSNALTHSDLQAIIDRHSVIFGDMPKELPPKRDHDHAIQLVLGSQPPTTKIHPIFYVSCLKKVIGQNIPTQIVLPKHDEEGRIILEPECILQMCTKKLRNKTLTQYLIQWKNLLVEEATWEDEEFIQNNPHLVSIEDNASFKRGGMLRP